VLRASADAGVTKMIDHVMRKSADALVAKMVEVSQVVYLRMMKTMPAFLLLLLPNRCISLE